MHFLLSEYLSLPNGYHGDTKLQRRWWPAPPTDPDAVAMRR